MSNWIKQDALRHEESKKSWNPWLHKVAEALKGFPWITDVTCPSRSALQYFDNPENYFATSGDGLLELLFEVLSYEGDGQICPSCPLFPRTFGSSPGEKRCWESSQGGGTNFG